MKSGDHVRVQRAAALAFAIASTLVGVQAAHARSSDVVDWDSVFFQIFQDADVGQSQGAAAQHLAIVPNRLADDECSNVARLQYSVVGRAHGAHARDHRRTIYEVMFMRPKPKTGETPMQAEVQILADHQSFAEAKGMDPGFGVILDQDTDNLYAQQEGLEASAKPGITLGDYQEIRVRHFEKAIDKYMAMDPYQPQVDKLQRC